MNTFRKNALIGMMMLGFASATVGVQAQNAPEGAGHMAMGGHHERDPAKHAERMARHQAELHDKLKLTAAQEPAWKTFTASMTPPNRANQPSRAEMRAQMEKLSAPERMEKMLANMKEHEAVLTKRLDALKTFYASLTPEQQKVFNDNFGGHGDGRGHGKRHHDKAPAAKS